MTCHEVDDSIEAIVAGDEPATEAFRTHVEGCLRCAAALATARRVEQGLAARPAPPAPARFTAAVTARLRSERWRAEQQVDRVFNAALTVGVLAVVGGLVALFNLGGVIAAVGSASAGLVHLATRAAGETVPTASTYLLAGALLGMTIIGWWFAEQRWSV